MAIESLATESFLSSKFMAVAGSLVIGACLEPISKFPAHADAL